MATNLHCCAGCGILLKLLISVRHLINFRKKYNVKISFLWVVKKADTKNAVSILRNRIFSSMLCMCILNYKTKNHPLNVNLMFSFEWFYLWIVLKSTNSIIFDIINNGPCHISICISIVLTHKSIPS